MWLRQLPSNLSSLTSWVNGDRRPPVARGQVPSVCCKCVHLLNLVLNVYPEPIARLFSTYYLLFTHHPIRVVYTWDFVSCAFI